MSHPTKLTASGEFGQKNFINDDVENAQSIEKDTAEGNDLDIDFSITESGRTVAHLIAHMKQDGNVEDDMDFSISSSGRTIDNILESGEKPLQGSNDVVGKKSVAKSMPKSVPTLLGNSNDYEQDSNSICSSGSAFVSGLMSNQSGVLSHTPPTGSSYEARHFGKRLRAGVSIVFVYKNRGFRIVQSLTIFKLVLNKKERFGKTAVGLGSRGQGHH